MPHGDKPPTTAASTITSRTARISDSQRRSFYAAQNGDPAASPKLQHAYRSPTSHPSEQEPSLAHQPIQKGVLTRLRGPIVQALKCSNLMRCRCALVLLREPCNSEPSFCRLFRILENKSKHSRKSKSPKNIHDELPIRKAANRAIGLEERSSPRVFLLSCKKTQ